MNTKLAAGSEAPVADAETIRARRADAVAGNVTAWAIPVRKKRVDGEWLLLVRHPEGGMTWVPPVALEEQEAQTIIEQGGWVDDLEQIPTV